MVEPMLIHNRFAERLRAEDATLALVDGQAGLLSALPGPGCAVDALRNNLIGLARLGHAFGLPTVLGACADPSYGPLLFELLDLFGPRAVSRRRRGSFWDDAKSRGAVLGHGRHHLIVAALTPGFGLAETALAARRHGLDVHAVVDASAGSDDAAGRVGLARMAAAGIHLTSWVAMLAELGGTGVDTGGGNGAAAVRDNLDRYANPASAR
jgi:hypothetical protein